MLAAEADGLAPQVIDQLVAASAGNPLALREIPRGLSAEQRAGRDLALAPLRPGDTLERAFRRRVDALPEPTRHALLVAACAETMRADVIAGALANAGLPPDALEPAEAAGLLALRGREIEFDHPLVRAAVYHGGSPSERRDAHRALADAFPDRSAERAWHRAAAAPMPDAGVAQALMDAAGDARGRAAFAAAARGFARAGELYIDDDERGRALLEAAGAATIAGELPRAFELAEQGARLAADPLLQADLRAMAARTQMRLGDPLRAGQALVREAERIEALDPVRAGTFLLESAVTHMIDGTLRAMAETALRVREVTAGEAPGLEFLATLLTAEALLALGETEEGDALLAAVRAGAARRRAGARAAGGARDGRPRVAVDGALRPRRGDLRPPDRLAARRRRRRLARLPARRALAPRLPPRAAGRPRWRAPTSRCASRARRARSRCSPTRSARSRRSRRGSAARTPRARTRTRASRCARPRARRRPRSTATSALGLLELGLGNLEAARDHGLAAERAFGETEGDEPGVARYAPDLLEVLWRLGQADEVPPRIDELARQADRPLHTWTQAVVERMRGLMASDDEVDAHFARALELHAQTRQPFETARTQLLHGERLRRAKRRADARAPLSAALQLFERLGAEPWTERARVRAARHRRPDRLRRARHRHRRADRPGAPDRAPGRPGPHQPRGRRRAVPQREDDRVPPRLDLPQARDPPPRRARGGAGDLAGGLGLAQPAHGPDAEQRAERGRDPVGEEHVERLARDQVAAALDQRGERVDLGHGLDPAREQRERDVDRGEEEDQEDRHLHRRAGLDRPQRGTRRRTRTARRPG